MIRVAALILLAMLVCSCQTTQPRLVAAGAVIVGGQSGWVDLRFPIVAVREVTLQDDVKVTVVHFGGFLDGRMVKLGVAIPHEWDEDASAASTKFWWSVAMLGRVDETSDDFVASLARLYGEHPDSPKCVESLIVNVVSLGDDPRLMAQRALHLKAFVEGADDEHYAEFYLNVDLKGRVVEINEKDPDYRKALLSALNARSP